MNMEIVKAFNAYVEREFGGEFSAAELAESDGIVSVAYSTGYATDSDGHEYFSTNEGNEWHVQAFIDINTRELVLTLVGEKEKRVPIAGNLVDYISENDFDFFYGELSAYLDELLAQGELTDAVRFR